MRNTVLLLVKELSVQNYQRNPSFMHIIHRIDFVIISNVLSNVLDAKYTKYASLSLYYCNNAQNGTF